MSRNLIISPVGDGSLHPGWLEPGASRQKFDVMLIYFGDKPGEYRDQCEHYICRKGSKWELLSSVIDENRELVSRYESIWLPDDDIRTDAATIARMFDQFHDEGLALAQPALTRDSFYSHRITLQQRFWTLRYTNFVELMVPIFRRDVLFELLGTFGANRSGWGLDYLWCQRVREKQLGRIAVMDRVPVTHTKAVNVGGGFYKALGIDPHKELSELLQANELEPVQRILGLRWGMLRLTWGY